MGCQFVRTGYRLSYRTHCALHCLSPDPTQKLKIRPSAFSTMVNDNTRKKAPIHPGTIDYSPSPPTLPEYRSNSALYAVVVRCPQTRKDTSLVHSPPQPAQKAQNVQSDNSQLSHHAHVASIKRFATDPNSSPDRLSQCRIERRVDVVLTILPFLRFLRIVVSGFGVPDVCSQ